MSVTHNLLVRLSPADCSQLPPEKRLEDMMRLGELCMEVLQQNDEHHSEVEHTKFAVSQT